jgi:hypothetical protein
MMHNEFIKMRIYCLNTGLLQPRLPDIDSIHIEWLMRRRFV